MHKHGPDELPGPVRGTAGWWRGMDAPPDEGPPLEQPSGTKTRKSPHKERPIRMDLVERVKKEIAAGTYDTDEKWEAALDRLLDRLERDG